MGPRLEPETVRVSSLRKGVAAPRPDIRPKTLARGGTVYRAYIRGFDVPADWGKAASRHVRYIGNYATESIAQEAIARFMATGERLPSIDNQKLPVGHRTTAIVPRKANKSVQSWDLQGREGVADGAAKTLYLGTYRDMTALLAVAEHWKSTGEIPPKPAPPAKVKQPKPPKVEKPAPWRPASKQPKPVVFDPNMNPNHRQPGEDRIAWIARLSRIPL